MIGWLIGAAWILGALVTFRPTVRAVIGDTYGGYEWDDVVFGSLIGGIVAAFFWPFAVMYFALRNSVANDPDRAARLLFGESRGEKMKRLENDKRERDAYVRKLERELGIDV